MINGSPSFRKQCPLPDYYYTSTAINDNNLSSRLVVLQAYTSPYWPIRIRTRFASETTVVLVLPEKKGVFTATRATRSVALAEWLRRVPAKYMGFPRESSNLSGDVYLFIMPNHVGFHFKTTLYYSDYF